MYLGDIWETVDGEPIYEIFIPKITSDRLLSKLSREIWEDRMLWAQDIRWKHVWVGRCTINSIVRHNTDDSLNRFKNCDIHDGKLCVTCRGKGHSWKAEIWNGRPYLIPEGQRMPKGDHWKNPDYCIDCGGSGLK